MADEVDQANDLAEQHLTATISGYRGYTLPKGEAGECDLCGEWSGRLIAGACAPCRDRYRIDAV